MTRYRAEIRLYVDHEDPECERHTSSMSVLADVTVFDTTPSNAVGQLFRHLEALAQRWAPDEPEPAVFDEECPF